MFCTVYLTCMYYIYPSINMYFQLVGVLVFYLDKHDITIVARPTMWHDIRLSSDNARFDERQGTSTYKINRAQIVLCDAETIGWKRRGRVLRIESYRANVPSSYILPHVLCKHNVLRYCRPLITVLTLISQLSRLVEDPSLA